MLITLVSVIVFSIVILLLVLTLILAESKLLPQGAVKILINNADDKSPSVNPGNTLLNSLNIKNKLIKYASENNKKKIGKYTPGSHIKIISDKEFLKKKIDYAILLSWNYKKFFLTKSLFIKKGGKFIIPLPTPHIK